MTAPETARGPSSTSRLRKLWFDAHVEGRGALDLLIETVGQDRLVYGTNFGGWDKPTSTSAFYASLTPNAERLLRLPGAESSSDRQIRPFLTGDFGITAFRASARSNSAKS